MESKPDEKVETDTGYPEVDRNIADCLANSPTDPVERLYWIECWLRVAAKKYAESNTSQNSTRLRRMAVVYAATEAALRGSK